VSIGLAPPATLAFVALRNTQSAGPMARPELVPFARWLRSEMRARRLTANGFALKVGASSSGMSLYMRGLSRPRLETLRRMADALDRPLAELEALLPPPDEGATGDLHKRDFEDRGIVAPAVTDPATGRPLSAVLLFSPDGGVDGVGPLTPEEEEGIRLTLERIRERRRARREGDGVGIAPDADRPGPGGPR
jgi:transcriptional regulator with XRE-family HTH domain